MAISVSKRYLITGGAGFIGSHLCDELLTEGHQVVVLDSFVSGKRENLPPAGGRLTVIDGDIRAIAKHADDIGKIDAVVHLAALISGYDSLLHPADYLDVNVSGLLSLIDFAAQNQVRRIVFASSSTVYGNQQHIRLTEDAPPGPLTVYALSKLTSEHLLRIYGAMHGFSHCSLRLFNVYGPRQAPDHPYANVTCKFAHAAAHGLPINLYGDGEQSRDFIYVADAVRAFMAVLNQSSQAIYNVGTGRTVRINELITKLGEMRGEPLAVSRQPPWPNDIRSISADTDRLHSEFGFRPDTGLSTGLQRTVEFFRTRAAAK